MPVDLTSFFADTLSAQGYRVEDASPIEGSSGASYPVSLVAHREGREYMVDVLASRTVRDKDVQALASIVDDTGLDGAIVLALEGDETHETPTDGPKVEVWDRPRIDAAVGQRVLDEVLAGDRDPDLIGPSPDAPVQAPESKPASRQSDGDAAKASTHPDPDTAEAVEHDEVDPTPEPTPTPSAASVEGGDAEILEDDSETSTTPEEPEPAEPEPAQPAAAQQPEAEPEPATAEDDGGAAPGTGVNQRDFVDPEDMLERAEELMQQGAVDDGDAELIVEDDDPDSTSPSQPEDTETRSKSPEASLADETDEADPDPDPEAIQPADDGSDAEILDSDPPTGSTTERPRPDGEPPEPQPASTARETPDPEPDTSTTPDSPSPAAATGTVDDEAFLSGATIEPKVEETEARRKADEALFDVESSRLELLPFQVFRYEAVLQGDGHESQDEGEVWVSTQSGAVVRAPRGDLVEEPAVAYERFQGSLSRAETEEAAREHLLDNLERREELRQDYSESAVIERVRLEPDPEALDLEPVGKAYAPRWRVEGQNGSVFVDAVTGELVNARS